jgi:anti-sigma regulatory factor (Ser/Thr protein kinase)
MSSAEGQTRTFRAPPAEISAADSWIEEVGRGWGIAERTTFGARICVAEIAANVLEHGATLSEPAQFGVTLRRRDSGLDVEITDSGRPFDPTTVADPPLSDAIDEAHIGGVSYRHDGVCNRLILHLRAALMPSTSFARPRMPHT